MIEKIKELHEKTKKALDGGGFKRIESQHKKKKLTARERIDLLLLSLLSLHNKAKSIVWW